MQQEPNSGNAPKGGLVGLIVAHTVCCGGILLAATGSLAGASAWFLEGGAVWLALALAAIAVIAAGALYRGVRRGCPARRSDPQPQNRDARAL
jgi:membrane protein implicated in regulation of membrane protease activity